MPRITAVMKGSPVDRGQHRAPRKDGSVAKESQVPPVPRFIFQIGTSPTNQRELSDVQCLLARCPVTDWK